MRHEVKVEVAPSSYLLASGSWLPGIRAASVERPLILPQRGLHPNYQSFEDPSKEPIITHSMIGFSALVCLGLMRLMGRMGLRNGFKSLEMAANIAIKPFAKKASQ